MSQAYWDREVKDTAILYATHLKGRPNIVDEGHHAFAPGGMALLGEAAVSGTERPAKTRRPRGGRSGKDKGTGKGFNAGIPRDQQECFRWTRDAAGCTEP